MSRVHERFDEEEAQLIDDPELNAELEAAIAEADAHPEDNIPWDEFMRKLRNGE
ncbi:MAG TPA: hypothetical protein VJZ76_23410 [Thermoanaerobaculia bacterium]|nr:hypothetical protein [Thermoanaerobaculia bacterium]